MIRWFTRDSQGGPNNGNLSRVDLAAMSLVSLLFGLALIVKGLIQGG